MAVGNAVLDIVLKKGFLTHVQKMSLYFHKKLQDLKKKYPNIIKEVRGIGLLVGLKLSVDQTAFINKLSDNKMLTIRAAENVVRLLPPLNVKKKDIDLGIAILNKVCKNYK